jgi:phosphatidylcholine synthase
MSSNQPVLRKILAWGVHFFTATGAAWSFLALLAINERDYRLAILWMIVAIFVDGVDGMLARLVDVKTYAPGIDGPLLDNILDYFTYVVVPAYLLYTADLLPPGWQLAGALSILLTSAYQFSQSDAKTDDHYFKGFPSYWNVLVIYMLAMHIPAWANLVMLVVFNVLVFVPVKYVYPSRSVLLHRVTLGLTYLYALIGTIAVLQYPDVPQGLMWVSLAYILYYLVLSLWPKKKPVMNGDEQG